MRAVTIPCINVRWKLHDRSMPSDVSNSVWRCSSDHPVLTETTSHRQMRRIERFHELQSLLEVRFSDVPLRHPMNRIRSNRDIGELDRTGP